MTITMGGLGGVVGLAGGVGSARGDWFSKALYLKVLFWLRRLPLAGDPGGCRAAPKQHHIRHHRLMKADGTRTPKTQVPDMADGVGYARRE